MTVQPVQPAWSRHRTCRPVSQLLSTRERQVLQCFADGMGRAGAAKHLGISETVVKTHVARMKDAVQPYVDPARINTRHMAALVLVGLVNGWIE